VDIKAERAQDLREAQVISKNLELMASQAGPTPLPPTIIHKSERISKSAAHDFLAAYLNRAATDPSLQPDSTLSGHGPVSGNAGSAPNLIIHNLKRVQEGLAGKVLGTDLTFTKLGGEGIFELQSHNFGDGLNWGDGKVQAINDDGWQDLQSYERQQIEEIKQEEVRETLGDRMDIDEVRMPQKTKIDKEERRLKKKERRKAEKRARTTV